MDPVETFRLFIEACDRNHHKDAVEHGDNLLGWLNRGGFTPPVSSFQFRCMVFQLTKAHAEWSEQPAH